MDKVRMSDIRKEYPMYGAEISDESLLARIHTKLHPEMPIGQFIANIEFDTDHNTNPTTGMGRFEKLAAGYAKPFVDVQRSARRLGNKLGFNDYDQAAAEEDEKRDKPLTDDGWGATGQGIGELALTALPGLKAAQGISRGVQAGAKMLPNALRFARPVAQTLAPYIGAAGAGAATGAALSPEDMSGGAKTGSAWGLAGEAGGRVLSGLYSGAKATIEPLYDEGRKRILKRTMERFVKDPKKVIDAAENAKQLVPGYSPTFAEATGDVGVAQLQRAAETKMPAVVNTLHEAKLERLAAYKSALDDLAGADGMRTFATGAREEAAKELYGKAYAEGLQLTPELEQQFATLMQRPSIQRALPKARERALEKGMTIGDNPGGSVAGVHWVKQSLDDDISALKAAGRGGEAGDIIGTQDELVGALQRASPGYANAMAEYQAMSRPINQMAVGEKLRNTLFPAVNDLSEDAFTTNLSPYSKLLREGDKTAQAATGLGGATMENVLDPAQLATVRGIGEDATRAARVGIDGKIAGSPTAQYIGARNIMQGFLGPLGVPESMFDHYVSRVAAGLLSLPNKLTGSETEELLARALRDPKVAAAIMQVEDNPTLIAKYLQPYAAQFAIQQNTE